MPVKLEIISETVEDLVEEFRRLNAETTQGPAVVSTALATMPLNDFITLANTRLERDGFMVACRPEPEEARVEALPEPEPEPAAKKAKAKAKAVEPEAIVESPSNVEEFPQPRRSKSNLASIEPASAKIEDFVTHYVENDPEGDRQYVLDTLAGILKDPARKAEVLAFTGKQAKLHGTEKISELPAAPFPAIRREMEKAFPDVAGPSAA